MATAKKIDYFFKASWDAVNIADGAPQSLARNIQVFGDSISSAMDATSPYQQILGPENLANDAIFVGVGAGFVVFKIGQQLAADIRYHKLGTAKYLDKQIKYYTNYLIKHSHYKDSNESDLVKLKDQIYQKVYDQLYDKTELDKLAKDLFGAEGKSYEVTIEELPDSSQEVKKQRIKLQAIANPPPVDAAVVANEDPTESDIDRLLKKTPEIIPQANPDNTVQTEPDQQKKQYNWFERLTARLEKNVIYKALALTREFIFKYALYYWTGWFLAWIFTGLDVATTPLQIGLTFGLPLIIPVAEAVWRGSKSIISFIKKKINPNPPLSSSDNDPLLEKDRRLLINTRLQQLYYQRLDEQLMKQRKSLNQELKIKGLNKDAIMEETQAQLDDKKQKATPRQLIPRKARRQQGEVKGKSLKEVRREKGWIAACRSLGKKISDVFHTRAARILFAAVSGAMAGYIITFFSAWPIQYALASAGIISAISPPGIILVFSLSVVFGLMTAVKSAANASIEHKKDFNQVIDKKAAFAEFMAVKAQNKMLRNAVEEKSRKLDEFDTINNKKDFIPRITAHTLDKEAHIWQTMKRKQGNKFIRSVGNVFNASCEWLFNSWTGTLLVRSLLSGGAMLSIFMPHIAVPVFAGLALGLMLTWGTYKLTEYYVKKAREADKKYIAEVSGYTQAMVKENAYLENEYTNQCLKLKIEETPIAVDTLNVENVDGAGLLPSSDNNAAKTSADFSASDSDPKWRSLEKDEQQHPSDPMVLVASQQKPKPAVQLLDSEDTKNSEGEADTEIIQYPDEQLLDSEDTENSEGEIDTDIIQYPDEKYFQPGIACNH